MKFLVVLVVCALAFAPSVLASAQSVEFKSGGTDITVKNNDGKAWAGKFEVQSENGELVKTVGLDGEGQATLAGIADGSYKMVFPGRAVLPFSVNPKGETTSLLVVLPPPPAYAAGEVKKAAELPVLALCVIGAVAVAGVAVVVAGGDGGGSGGHEASVPE